MSITIKTADRRNVHEGDRVYNYYDCKWGVIGKIDSYAQSGVHWFDFVADDGSRSTLDGSRISTTKP